MIENERGAPSNELSLSKSMYSRYCTPLISRTLRSFQSLAQIFTRERKSGRQLVAEKMAVRIPGILVTL